MLRKQSDEARRLIGHLARKLDRLPERATKRLTILNQGTGGEAENSLAEELTQKFRTQCFTLERIVRS
jgi:hypothetical protein